MPFLAYLAQFASLSQVCEYRLVMRHSHICCNEIIVYLLLVLTKQKKFFIDIIDLGSSITNIIVVYPLDYKLVCSGNILYYPGLYIQTYSILCQVSSSMYNESEYIQFSILTHGVCFIEREKFFGRNK